LSAKKWGWTVSGQKKGNQSTWAPAQRQLRKTALKIWKYEIPGCDGKVKQ